MSVDVSVFVRSAEGDSESLMSLFINETHNWESSAKTWKSRRWR